MHLEQTLASDTSGATSVTDARKMIPKLFRFLTYIDSLIRKYKVILKPEVSEVT